MCKPGGPTALAPSRSISSRLGLCLTLHNTARPTTTMPTAATAPSLAWTALWLRALAFAPHVSSRYVDLLRSGFVIFAGPATVPHFSCVCVQAPLPGGTSFYFQINGLPIPVHGSNWVPADAFESRVSRATLTPFFRALTESHQNMIRNWGGGIYQRDSFYDLADEHGIMIWEDMMWACAKYAVPTDYLLSSAKEVRDNVRRLHRHPSIALWAGNNENEQEYRPDQPEIQYYSDLYFRTVLANISALDDSRPMVGSSPSNGNETAEEPGCYNCKDEFHGDDHLYLYGEDCWDVTVYSRPRFQSEYGLQSWPSAATMAKYIPPNERYYNSSMMTNRNHHPDGQPEILSQIAMHYKVPQGNTEKAWNDTLYLSQVYQAYCYKIETEHFRRLRTECTDKQPGCNMGQMFWQTQNIWPGASWAAIDSTGRYLMVQYYARHFYQPVLATAFIMPGGEFGLYVVVDSPSFGISAGTLEFTLYSWQHGQRNTFHANFTAPPASAGEVFKSSVKSIVQQGGCEGAQDCVLVYKAYNGSQLVDTNFIFLASLKDSPLQDPHLKITSVAAVAGEAAVFTVTYTGSAVAAFVWLETPLAGHFSDNGMLRVDTDPSHTDSVLFYADDAAVTAQQLQETLTITSIYSTYN
eukprot:m.158510 g.158510  ORF g.158510 m.158510 type:complete len:637 (-) comp20881_c0_seq3:84-1994(-)